MREHCIKTGCSATEQMSNFGLFIMVIFPDKPSPKVKRVGTSLKGTHNPEAFFSRVRLKKVEFIGTQQKKKGSFIYTYSYCMGRLTLFPSNGKIWVSMTNGVLVTVATLPPMMKQLIMDKVKGEAKESTYKINAYTVLHA